MVDIINKWVGCTRIVTLRLFRRPQSPGSRLDTIFFPSVSMASECGDTSACWQHDNSRTGDGKIILGLFYDVFKVGLLVGPNTAKPDSKQRPLVAVVCKMGAKKCGTRKVELISESGSAEPAQLRSGNL